LSEEYAEAVLDLVDAIPPGRVMTYGGIAEVLFDRLGRSGPRQVGAVLSRMGGEVPWWRVVNASGRPPARHAHVALERLAAEGCPLTPDSTRVCLRGAAWEPPRQFLGDT
jgi:methylated-DNA-protein-cysteine methyltransferase-like protein